MSTCAVCKHDISQHNERCMVQHCGCVQFREIREEALEPPPKRSGQGERGRYTQSLLDQRDAQWVKAMRVAGLNADQIILVSVKLSEVR